MSIRPPSLDDRRFDDLVEELVARIPAHTPEWTHPRPGDPGRTLVELFAWLADTLLYRANLVPERQRLAFLRLLGAPLRPAVPARGLVGVSFEDDATEAVTLRAGATVKGPPLFETLSELTVLPVTDEAYAKRRLDAREAAEFTGVLPGLQEVYRLGALPTPYVTTPVFPGGAADPAGFDLLERTVDGCLWLALLAPDPDRVPDVRATLGAGLEGRAQVLTVGLSPALAVPALFEDIGPRARIPHAWEMSTGREIGGEPEYVTLDVIHDGTAGLRRRGVQRLVLPAARDIGAPVNDPRAAIDAGVGDRPPRLDDPDHAVRLVAWLRLRPGRGVTALPLAWVGVNAVEVDQRLTLTDRVIGQSDGRADQELALPGTSVDPATFGLEVEETGLGYRRWQAIDDLATASRDDAVFTLDAEAGTVRFGDGARGRIPEVGRRVRVASMRAGGGRAGNLPPGSLTAIAARGLSGAPVTRALAVAQPLATEGGEEAETVAEAERRIPALLRDRDRAVTAEDYRRVAAGTPGVHLGRVEVLSRFKPHQRRHGVPGVVSVMVLPARATTAPPAPRADRPLLEAVHEHLEPRRPLGTELYVIDCEYVPLGVSVGLAVRDGAARDTVLHEVRQALRGVLWPLGPGGPDGEGWPLGRAVRDRELEVAVARVAGVRSVAGVNLFEQRPEGWRVLPRPTAGAPVELALEPWQLPELLAVVVGVDEEPPPELRLPPPGPPGVAVPVVPERC